MSKKGGQKKKGDDDLTGHANFILKNQILSLGQKITHEQERADRAKTNELNLQKRIIQLDSEFTEEKQKLRSVTQKMSEQYKRVQSQYQEEVNKLEQEVDDQNNQITQLDQDMVEYQHEHEEKMLKKEEELTNLKRKVEEMSQEFAKMLRDTLDKMQQRIELVQWDNDSEPQMSKRLKEITGAALDNK